MKKLQIITLAFIIAIGSSSFMLDAKKNVSQATHKRHKSAKQAQAAAQVAQKNIASLTGQPLVDAINKRNMDLSADIANCRAHIKAINQHRGRIAVIKNGKSVMRWGARTKQQKATEIMNLNQITLDQQEINSNNTLLAKAQQGLALAAVQQAQQMFINFLQQNNGNSGQIPADLQAALTAYQTASYNQGKSDQSAIDAPAIQNAYNQGLSDGQNQAASATGSSSAASSTTTTNAPAANGCDDGSTPAMMCADGTAPSASNVCDDQSTPAMMCSDGTQPGSASTSSPVVCDDGSTPDATSGLCADGTQPGTANASNVISSCDDGSNAVCDDNTNLSLQTCDDQSSPDINGMCADGTLVACTDKTSPVCSDGSAPALVAA